MHTRKLGTQGLEVSAVGLGVMGMSGMPGVRDMYGPVGDEAESIATIHRALEVGVTFFDTAEVYGPYINEELLGRALRGKRERAVIATKFGFRFTPEGRIGGVDGRPENVRRALDASLKRLGVDHVDIWYQHRRDRSVPIEDTVGAMAEQVRAGKARYLGLSEVGVDTLRRAYAVHPISVLQSEYSIWERNIESGEETSVLAACRALGIGIVPYSPLGRGFLSGSVKRAEELPEGDYRRSDPRFQGENFDRNLRVLEAVRDIAERHRATPSQIALAWLLHQGPDIAPIPGTKRRQYLEENAAAADIRLGSEDLAALDDVAPTTGPRYSERSMSMIDR
jgi:aryl-alcohol dehydrogenase-like predicted oxidoreductase